MALTTALVAATVGGAVYSSRKAGKAADAQVQASDRAIAAGQTAEERSLALMAPQREAGYRALAAAMDMTGLSRGTPTDTEYNPVTGAYEPRAQGEAPNLADYEQYNWQTDPGYQFRLDEGMRAIERSASARGILNSGGTIRSALRYSQDYASNEYQKVYERISGIAGFGNQANTNSVNVITGTAQNTANALTNAGEARASGYVAQGNAWANATNQFATMYGAGLFGK